MKLTAEVLRLFFFVGWRRQLILLVVMLAGVVAENFSIASLWPIFNAISDTGKRSTPISDLVQDAITSVGIEPTFGTLLIFLCLAAAAKFVLSTGGKVYVGRQVSHQAMQLRLNLLGAITRSRWSFVISTPSGRLTAALGEEGDRAAGALSGANNFVVKAVETAAYLIGCLWMSWQFSLAAIVIAAILWLAVAKYIRAARRAGRKKWRSTHLLSGAVEDLLTSMKSLRAMNRQFYLGRFASAQIAKLRNSVEREYYSETAIRAVQEPLLAIMMLGGAFVGHQFFDLGLVELVATAWLLARIASGVGGMRAGIHRVALDGIAVQSILDLTQAMKDHAEVLHSGQPARLARECRYDNVSFGYGSKPIISDASFALSVGEVTTLIGPSGAGKTTIADLLVGLHEPESGRVLVDGVPLNQIDLTSWRSNLGYIPQDTILFNTTIMENVALGDPAVSEEAVIDALKQAGAWSFVSQLPEGINEVIGVRGNLLSGGQKQRLSIARALIYKPQLLILDEATSALDQATAVEICDAVRGLRGDRTILAITHQAIWTGVADQILKLSDGKLQASPAE
jgi:ATP-binding cassette, subfamily C, bacterial